MAEKILEKIIEPMVSSFNFWRTYKDKKVKITVETSLHPLNAVTYFDLRRTIVGKAVEIVDFPSSIVVIDGEEVTSQARVGHGQVYANKPVEAIENRERFNRKAISLYHILSIEILE